MESGLRDQAVLVTGASGGIGAATAAAFAGEGCAVAVHYFRNSAGAEGIAKDLSARHGVTCIAVGGDLRQEDEVQGVFDQTRAALGRLDHLVVNAGVAELASVPVHRMSLEQWDDTLTADLTSAFLCSRAFFRLLEQEPRDECSLVFVASTAALYGEAGHCDYSAAKAAMAHGLTLSLKNEIVELAPRGRVNCVCPGWVRTPMTETLVADPRHVQKATATMALQKIATPDDIARSVLFLASPRLAGHISGEMLTVAGGMEGRLLHGELKPPR